MKGSDAEIAELVARVSRAVAARTGRSRGEVAELVAAEIAAALTEEHAGSPPGARPPSSPPRKTSGAPAPSRGDTAATKPADPDAVREALGRVETCARCQAEERRRRGGRAVVTTTGKNRRGVVARIAQGIAEAGGDIIDISQTLVSDYFTMIIIVDVAELEVPFADFKARITQSVRSLGAECLVMHEEVVAALQRV